MAYLIDGSNLIGSISPKNLKSAQYKYYLALKLRVFQKYKRTRIIIVYDGPPDPDLMTKILHEKRFSILYPSYDQDADQVIKNIIQKETDPRKLHVVSSDREIRDFARARGAKTIKCDEFRRELAKATKEQKALREEEKNVSHPSPLEIDHWLKIFKNEND